MRFEIELDDGNNLNTLHAARKQYNVENPDNTADDLPAFVQRMADQLVAAAIVKYPPAQLTAANDEIAELKAKLAAAEAKALETAAPASNA